MLYTASRETGDLIEKVDTIKNGLNKIKEYEKDDKKDGIYEPNFYDIVNEKHESQM